MKVLKTLVICLLLTLPFAGTRAQFLYWNYHNILDEVREGGLNPDMEIDASGNYHISFWNPEEERLIYGFRNAAGGSWTFEYVDSFGVNGWVSSIALDPSGTPYIAYFESVSGQNFLRIAHRTGPGAWIMEAIPGHPTRGDWGRYGPGDMINTTTRLHPSIDLIFKVSGEPTILFFDMFVSEGSFPGCTFSSNYGLKMWQAYLKPGSVWAVTSYGVVPDINRSCGGAYLVADYPLPFGDRYGEFVQVTQNPSGGLTAISPSRYNTHILVFNSNPGDTTWAKSRIDTMQTAVGGGWGSPEYQLNRFFTWESTVVDFSPDGTFHSAYTSSLEYGDNFCCMSFNALVYNKLVAGDSVYSTRVIKTDRYFANTSIHSENADTVFISYSDLTGENFCLSESHDGGTSWTHDTLFGQATTCSSPMRVAGGKINILLYDRYRESLLLATRDLYGAPGSWTFEDVTISQQYGTWLDAAVTASPVDTTVFAAFNEANSDILYFGTGSATGSSFSWSFEIPDTLGSDFRSIHYLTGPAGEHVVFYTSGSPGDLKMAIKSGGAWNVFTIADSVNASYLSAALGSDNVLHLAWYNGGTHFLYHGTSAFGSGSWSVEVVDSSNDRTGEFCSLVLNSVNEPRIAYYNDSTLSLHYAELNAGVWTKGEIYRNEPSPVGKYISLRLLADERPAIGFLDEQNLKVMYAERSSSLVWGFTALDSGAVFGIGKPINLEIDKFGNPWVAYNYASAFEKTKLMHRDTSWKEVTVSTAGNIANSFRFMIEDDDLYILGTKSAVSNTGLAMITAPRGLYIKTDDPVTMANTELTIFPNPGSEVAHFSLDVKKSLSAGLEIVTLLGQHAAYVVKEETLQPGKHDFLFDVSTLPPGMYLVRMTGEASTLCGKLMVTGH